MQEKKTKRVREPGKRLQQIVDTSTQLFYENGFDKTSVSDIANALSLEKPTLYHYIKSKDDLLLLILENFLNELIASLEGQKKEKDTSSLSIIRTQRVLTEQFKIFAKRRRESIIFFREVKALPEKYRAQVQALQKKYMQLLSVNFNVLRKTQGESKGNGKKDGKGAVSADRQAAKHSSVLPLAFLGLCSTLVENISPSVQHMEGTLKEMVDFFIHGAARKKEK